MKGGEKKGNKEEGEGEGIREEDEERLMEDEGMREKSEERRKKTGEEKEGEGGIGK